MKYLLLLSLSFLVACQSAKKEERIDMSDIIPSSEDYAEGDTLKVEEFVNDYDSLSLDLKTWLDTSKIDRQSVTKWDTTLFCDRFVHKSREKILFSTQNQMFQLARFTFKDSLFAKNMFFNWMDCFSAKCKSLQLWESKRLVAESFLIVVFEKQMWYITSNESIDTEMFLDKLTELYVKQTPLYVLAQKKSGKTVWWGKVEDKWQIKKLEL
jgi:hypothetical protein